MQDTQAACRAKLRELLASDRLSVFAFATSSLKGVPIQVVALDADGDTRINQIIQTDQPLDPGSQAFHGLSAADVAGGLWLRGIMEDLEAHLDEDLQVITFSPDFSYG